MSQIGHTFGVTGTNLFLFLFGNPARNGSKAGFGLVRTNIYIQWNPVYKVFHRINFFGNEPVVR